MILRTFPRSDEDTTYYGLPFVNGNTDFTGIVPSQAVLLPDDEAATAGQIRYTPLPVMADISVTDLLVLVSEGPDGPDPSTVRVAILRADEDWQPVGSPLVDETFEVAVLPIGDQYQQEIPLAEPVALETGMHLLAIEDDGVEGAETLSISGHFAGFPGSFFLAPGEGSPGELAGLGTQLPCFVAPHTFGESDLPSWSDTDFRLVALGFQGGSHGSFFYPFFLKWE